MRLLVDKNGDGVISDNETGADVMDSWNSTVSAGQTFSSGTMDDEGNEEPAEYNVAFSIRKSRQMVRSLGDLRYTIPQMKTFTIRYPEFPYTKVMRKMGRQ